MKTKSILFPGDVIDLSRLLKARGSDCKPGDASNVLLGLLAELDRLGYHADILVRRKVGRPTNLSVRNKDQMGLLSSYPIKTKRKKH